MLRNLINIKLLLVIFLIGCSVNNFSLLNGGMSTPDRKNYVKARGIGFPNESKKAFIEGKIIIGMHKNLVLRLYGAPDQVAKEDNQWMYADKLKIYVIDFENNVVYSTNPEIEKWR